MVRVYVPGLEEPGKVVDIGRKKVMGWVRGVLGFCGRNSPVFQSRGLTDGDPEEVRMERTLFNPEEVNPWIFFSTTTKGQLQLVGPVLIRL